MDISIHLMLLFIYFITLDIYLFLYFNTSHVTVYPFWPAPLYQHKLISIHLMLLFIKRDLSELRSCIISIHLMLLFIQVFQGLIWLLFLISIHLMLLFISTEPEQFQFIRWFQYISCYCLSNELTPFYIFLRI